LRSLASALFLTERDAEYDENKPKVKGRIITTLPKAKEVRPLVEKCITVARRGLAAEDAARQHGTQADRGSDAWKTWRKSAKWRDWNKATAPAVAPADDACSSLATSKQCWCSSMKSPRASPIALAATRAFSASPNPASVMPASVPLLSSLACATES